MMRTSLTLIVLLTLRSISPAAPAGADERGDPATRASDAGDAGDDARLSEPRVPLAGPPIRAVLAAAYAAAGLDRDPGRGWIRRARLAGLVPWLTVRTTRDTSWQDAHSEIGHGNSFEIRATWRLDRLLFDGREVQVAAVEAARRRERQRLATRVIHLYFAWRGVAESGAGAQGDRTAARRTEHVSARVAELTAELDALTDGWFSDELARRRREASQTQPPPRAAP